MSIFPSATYVCAKWRVGDGQIASVIGWFCPEGTKLAIQESSEMIFVIRPTFEYDPNAVGIAIRQSDLILMEPATLPSQTVGMTIGVDLAGDDGDWANNPPSES